MSSNKKCFYRKITQKQWSVTRAKPGSPHFQVKLLNSFSNSSVKCFSLVLCFIYHIFRWGRRVPCAPSSLLDRVRPGCPTSGIPAKRWRFPWSARWRHNQVCATQDYCTTSHTFDGDVSARSVYTRVARCLKAGLFYCDETSGSFRTNPLPDWRYSPLLILWRGVRRNAKSELFQMCASKRGAKMGAPLNWTLWNHAFARSRRTPLLHHSCRRADHQDNARWTVYWFVTSVLLGAVLVQILQLVS